MNMTAKEFADKVLSGEYYDLMYSGTSLRTIGIEKEIIVMRDDHGRLRGYFDFNYSLLVDVTNCTGIMSNQGDDYIFSVRLLKNQVEIS